MAESNYDPNHDDLVRTQTLSIKLYSDNPIHNAIGRIIKYCEFLDNPNIDKNYEIDVIREAAQELAELCLDEKLERMNKLIYKLCEQKTNKD